MLLSKAASAQTGTAVLTYPPPGATNVDIFKPFTWAAVPNVQVYYIYVGTTPGAKDVFDSAEIASSLTSFSVGGMLPNSTYYATFWTKINGIWTYNASTIQTGPPDPLPDKTGFYSLIESLTAQARGMTQGISNNPTPDTLLDSEVTQRGLSTFADCVDYANVLMDLLLNNRIPARRRDSSLDGTHYESHTMVEYYDPFLQKWDVADPTFGVIYFDDKTQQGQSLEEISSLVLQKNFAALFAKYVTSNGKDYVEDYYMDFWTTYLNPVPPGSASFPVQNDPHPYLTPHTLAEVQSVPGVFLFEFASARDSVQVLDPQAGPITLGPQANTLFGAATPLNQGWRYNSVPANLKVYTFPRFWTHSATLLTPADTGSTVASQDPTTPIYFTWTAIAGAQAYYVYVGTTQGAKDVYDSGELSGTWLRIQIPPHGQEYVRLWTKYNGVWTYHDTSFQTGPLSSRLLTPANNARGVDYTQPVLFTWTSVPEAVAYTLYVGTSLGGQDVYDSGEISTTNLSLQLQPNAQYFVRMWTKESSGWFYADSAFRTAAELATVASPANNAVNVDPSAVQFAWNSVPNVQCYYLYLGTSVGAKDVYDSGEIQTTNLSLNVQPNRHYYARLWIKAAGLWYYSDSSFQTSSGIARLITPANNAVNVDSTFPVQFSWTSVPNVQTYYLYVGSSVGAKDVYDSGEILTTSLSIPLQRGKQYYVRLWSKVGGTWYYSDTAFQTGTGLASLISPANGAIGLSSTVLFQWSSVSDAQTYYLYVGSSPGAKDVYDSGEISVTSLTITLQPNTTYYVRLWTKKANVWYYSDSSFKTGSN